MRAQGNNRVYLVIECVIVSAAGFTRCEKKRSDSDSCNNGLSHQNETTLTLQFRIVGMYGFNIMDVHSC